MSSEMNIAFAVNDSYVAHLEVALFSLLKNNQNHTMSVYVLSSDISSRSKDRLRLVCKSYKDVRIKFIKLEDAIFRGFKAEFHFSRDIYSRYLLPELLPSEDKVLYLDSDILVTGDLGELYDTDIEDDYVAAALDLGIGKPMFRDYLSSLGLSGKSYFNSGVLLMNLGKIRADGKVSELIKTTEEMSEKLRHPDQDVINIVFAKNIKAIGARWNHQDEDRKSGEVLVSAASILHYTTEKKPWNTPNSSRSYNTEAHEIYEESEREYFDLFGYSRKVSIIIPVYNTDSKYLEECLLGVVNQTYSNIEIIIVDDGSNKDTADILDSIATTDDRIKVLHIKNGGSNNARRVGFEASSGDYVMFIDADDTVSRNIVHKLFRACVNDMSDVAMCEYSDDIMGEFPSGSVYDKSIYNRSDNIPEGIYTGFSNFRTIPVVVWSKLYERSVIETIDWSFSEYSMSEDEFMAVQVYSNIDRLSLVRDQLYHYRLGVDTSKEANYPSYNSYKGKMIPMLRTPRDLYEKSKQLYIDRGVDYNEDSLIMHYLYFIGRCASKLFASGGLDKNNKRELELQRGLYLHSIMESETLTDHQKIRAIIAFDSPAYIPFFNDAEKRLYAQIGESEAYINGLTGELDSLRREQGEYLRIKRSIRLLAGNIKRRLGSR